MKKILLVGAGKSATCLIDYLVENAPQQDWQLVVADNDLELAASKTGGSTYALPVQMDITDEKARKEMVAQADIVISMLPAALHILLARDCLEAGKHLLTASYADEEIKQLATAIREKNILFLCEMGLDPGIDHMSATQLIHRLKAEGAKIDAFYSHCGGLIAPESDDNPWHYKISWNPRNIIVAGKSGAIYKQDNTTVNLAYEHLFDPNRTVSIPGNGEYAWYPNRNSLSYMPLYQLEETVSFIRTTLRHPDFCTGWRKVVEMGLTDETAIYDTNNLSYNDFLRLHLLQQKVRLDFPVSSKETELITYLGLYSHEKIGIGQASPAAILQHCAEQKLMLRPMDKDMIIMLHEIEYTQQGSKKKVCSCLVVKGEDHLRTAMAKTVGLPLGIAAKLILQNKLTLTGLHIPVSPEIYIPVLSELKKEGIVFSETVS